MLGCIFEAKTLLVTEILGFFLRPNFLDSIIVRKNIYFSDAHAVKPWNRLNEYNKHMCLYWGDMGIKMNQTVCYMSVNPKFTWNNMTHLSFSM